MRKAGDAPGGSGTGRMKMTHAIYLVPDADRAQVFLNEVVGLDITADEETITGERFLTMGCKSFGIELQIVESAIQPAMAALKKQAGLVDFILQPENIQRFMNKVEGAGLTIHRKPTSTSYGITAIFEDPFGNLWDVVERLAE